MKKNNILIGGAWVYANGPLHIGHIAGLLPGDVIARYYRAKGDNVSYVSGSDCHGTPITIRAKQEGKSPKEISDYYHEEFIKGFDYLGFSYDYYGKTSSKEHIRFCVDFHEKLYDSPYVEEKEEPHAYCGTCEKYLPDRLIEGVCPHCGGSAKGEQCDHCGSIFHGTELIDPWCSECHGQPEFRDEKHLYLKLSELKGPLLKQLRNGANKQIENTDEEQGKNIDDEQEGNAGVKEGTNKKWRRNALDFTKRYINEGLKDRAITRHLDWGIHVPKDGYEDKRIYIWAENVLGYLSSNKCHCDQTDGFEFEDFWREEALSYYVHGKDNIPFHSIILPGLLLAHGDYNKLPDYIVSSEHLTLEGSKISTSNNWAVWVKDLIDVFNADAIRYYLLNNSPEKRDADFSFREFYYANNSELLGGFGNLVNRTLTFIHKSFEGKVPSGQPNAAVKRKVRETYDEVGSLIEAGQVKEGIKKGFELVKYGNKYFDENKPWIAVKTDKEIADQVLYNCVFIIENLARILAPFLPLSCERIRGWFGINNQWEVVNAEIYYELPGTEILFERLDESGLGAFKEKCGL